MKNWYLAIGALAVIVAGYFAYKAWEKHQAMKMFADLVAAAAAAPPAAARAGPGQGRSAY